MKIRFACPLLAALPIMAAADGVALNPIGIWAGTLGELPVKACFNKRGAGADYYYMKYLQPIELTQQGARWREPDGSWSLEVVDDDHLRGTWTSHDGAKTLPIALTLVDGRDDPAACARESFMLPLEQAPRVTPGKRQKFNQHVYRTLTGVGQQTLELLDAGHGIASINQQLRALVDESPATVAAYRAADRRVFGGNPMGGPDELNATPAYWSSNWITVNFYRWAAGMGKSGISYGQLTWNLATGKRVDLWRWFGGADAYADDPFHAGHAPMPAALRELVFKDAGMDAADADTECSTNRAPTAEYLISLRDDGMDFVQDARGDGCDLSFSLSFDQLRPVMTPEGRAAVGR